MEVVIQPPAGVSFIFGDPNLSALVDDAGVVYWACTHYAKPRCGPAIFRQADGQDSAQLVAGPEWHHTPRLVRHPQGAYAIGWNHEKELIRMDIPGFTVTPSAQNEEARDAYERATDCMAEQARQVAEACELAELAVDIAEAAKQAVVKCPTDAEARRYASTASRAAVAYAMDEAFSWRDPRLALLIERIVEGKGQPV